MAHIVDLEKIIIQGIKDLPNSYLDEIADFVFFLREKRNKQLVTNSESLDQQKAKIRMINDAKHNAPKLESSLDIRALIDQTHERHI